MVEIAEITSDFSNREAMEECFKQYRTSWGEDYQKRAVVEFGKTIISQIRYDQA